MKHMYAYFLLVLTSFAFNTHGQEPRSSTQGTSVELQRQKLERNYYRKNLGIDSVKALQVSQVQNTYKSALKAVVADTSLNELAKRARIGELMEIKNRKLRSMLSPAQQEKIIPSTERMPAQTKKP